LDTFMTQRAFAWASMPSKIRKDNHAFAAHTLTFALAINAPSSGVHS